MHICLQERGDKNQLHSSTVHQSCLRTQIVVTQIIIIHIYPSIQTYIEAWSSTRSWWHAGETPSWLCRRGRRREGPSHSPTSTTTGTSANCSRASSSSAQSMTGTTGGRRGWETPSERPSRRPWCTTTRSPAASASCPMAAGSPWSAPAKGWCSWRRRQTCGSRTSASRYCRRSVALKASSAMLGTLESSLEATVLHAGKY